MNEALTPTEAAVTRLWAELLEAEPKSRDADFFELGGQSLTLLRFVARVQDAYGVELPVEMLFAEDLTVAVAARAIDESLAEGADDGRLEELMAELDALSDEQVRALLAEGGDR
ncbi:phosphopantetheine-binding protein [Actinocorallia longicatena]|uniref:Carrier domain-containing protein n=1 Tax=Actinocorallia longicatena TaxID=111803 RepID=A0ABP6PZI9_9ACTN